MTWTLVLLALGVTAGASIIVGSAGRAASGGVREYLLADQNLPRRSVAQLLFSTSFSLNGMLYQIWLGYAVGCWALLVQGVWALSYFLLARHTTQIRESRSLHTFLLGHFGPRTKVLAAWCSILGFAVLIGWEFYVGRETFSKLITDDASGARHVYPTALVLASVLACFVYTSIGGLRGNAIANAAQNIIKLLTFALLIALLLQTYGARDDRIPLVQALLPSFGTLIEQIGVFGLITNLAFSLVWQFVDMSTWQSVIASKDSETAKRSAQALMIAGGLVFLAPGIVGTLIGVGIRNAVGVDSNTIMSSVIASLGSDSPVLMFTVAVALFAAMMSTIDGMLLASAYTLVCDARSSTPTLQEIDSDEVGSRRTLAALRAFLLLVALAGTLGMVLLVDTFHFGLFDVVYVLIVSQLSLLGPVLLGLARGAGLPAQGEMMAPILAGLAVGFGCVAIGKCCELEWALTGAGFFTMLTSAALSFAPWQRAT